jgi:hypothetical protein
LWKIGAEGVSKSQYQDTVARFPKGYKYLVSNQVVYNSSPTQTLAQYKTFVSRYFQNQQPWFVFFKIRLLSFFFGAPLFFLEKIKNGSVPLKVDRKVV